MTHNEELPDELTQEQLALFKQQLLDIKASLLEDLNDTTGATQTVVLDQQSVGRLSRMDALQMQQMALETQRRQQQQIPAINQALYRIEQKTYGYCLKCGELINPKRLAINPSNTLCIHCA